MNESFGQPPIISFINLHHEFCESKTRLRKKLKNIQLPFCKAHFCPLLIQSTHTSAPGPHATTSLQLSDNQIASFSHSAPLLNFGTVVLEATSFRTTPKMKWCSWPFQKSHSYFRKSGSHHCFFSQFLKQTSYSSGQQFLISLFLLLTCTPPSRISQISNLKYRALHF